MDRLNNRILFYSFLLFIFNSYLLDNNHLFANRPKMVLLKEVKDIPQKFSYCYWDIESGQRIRRKAFVTCGMIQRYNYIKNKQGIVEQIPSETPHGSCTIREYDMDIDILKFQNEARDILKESQKRGGRGTSQISYTSLTEEGVRITIATRYRPEQTRYMYKFSKDKKLISFQARPFGEKYPPKGS